MTSLLDFAEKDDYDDDDRDDEDVEGSGKYVDKDLSGGMTVKLIGGKNVRV